MWKEMLLFAVQAVKTLSISVHAPFISHFSIYLLMFVFVTANSIIYCKHIKSIKLSLMNQIAFLLRLKAYITWLNAELYSSFLLPLHYFTTVRKRQLYFSSLAIFLGAFLVCAFQRSVIFVGEMVFMGRNVKSYSSTKANEWIRHRKGKGPTSQFLSEWKKDFPFRIR